MENQISMRTNFLRYLSTSSPMQFTISDPPNWLRLLMKQRRSSIPRLFDLEYDPQVQVLSIDPGTEKMGLASWTIQDETTPSLTYSPSGVWSLKVLTEKDPQNKEMIWLERAEKLAHEVNNFAEDRFDVIVCEYPTSMGLVGRTSNSVGKLLYQVAYLRGILSYDRWYWYPTNTWKGSLPQHVIAQRVNKLLHMEFNTKEGFGGRELDAAHAAGLGLYYGGYALGIRMLHPYFGGKGGITSR